MSASRPASGATRNEGVTSASRASQAEGPGSNLTPFERHLAAENTRLRDEVAAIKVRPLPPAADRGYEVWRALMGDLRADGVVNLSVRYQTVMEVTYEPA